MKKLLFLCTGNYYRSRFAEILFNERAERNGLNWRASSHGIASEINRLRNPSPISQYAITGLAALNITPADPVRFPQKATKEELETADYIIALSEKEHRPMLKANYPEFCGEVEFWEIGDVDIESSEDALQRLQHKVMRLIENLNNVS